MSLEKHRQNVLKAASFMHQSDGSDGPALTGPGVETDVFTYASKAKDEIAATQPLFSRKEQIKEEASERTHRIEAKLQEIQDELAAISDLFEEGARDGNEIRAHAKTANDFLTKADKNVGEADSLVADSVGSSLALRFFSSAEQEVAVLGNSLPAIADVGQRHIDHFTAATESNKNLRGEFTRAGESVTAMLGQIASLGESSDQYARMAEQGEPQRTVQLTDNLATIASSTAVELRSFVANQLT